jgi:hypothetical protein
MISANLSWKNPNEVETVGQHREQKARRRDEDSKSLDDGSIAGSQRPRTRDTVSSRAKLKAATLTSSKTDSTLPKTTVLPFFGAETLSFLFPRQEAESLFEAETASSVASTSNSISGMRPRPLGSEIRWSRCNS